MRQENTPEVNVKESFHLLSDPPVALPVGCMNVCTYFPPHFPLPSLSSRRLGAASLQQLQ